MPIGIFPFARGRPANPARTFIGITPAEADKSIRAEIKRSEIRPDDYNFRHASAAVGEA
jgi:hypothetical protein